MSSDTWSQLQAHKRKQENLKERLLKRRKERQGLVGLDVGEPSLNQSSSESSPAATIKDPEGEDANKYEAIA